MCGIFGTIRYTLPDPPRVLQSLAHRGPDEQRFKVLGDVTLLHARLAIQDLSPAGRQPMEYEGLHIIFNGEIYNHWELREKYGIRHESRSDTMTILLLYERMGMDMLQEFDGMFALALYDSRRGKVWLARDRAGKKPLYLWRRGDQFVFSSELNALAQVVRPIADEEALAGYLYLGYHYRTETPYRDVRELENGTVTEIRVADGVAATRRWFRIEEHYREKTSCPEAEALARLDECLQVAVRRRIDSSDLEVGSFLSGGIDSGLVTAIAARHTRHLRSFTVQMPGAYDESGLAALVAERYGTIHETIGISFDGLRDDFVRIVSGYGEPFFDSSAIPSFYVAQAARKHITVVLNGDGADELFGGYRRYVPFRYHDFFAPSRATQVCARLMRAVLPFSDEKKSLYNYLFRLVRFAAYSAPEQMYNAATTDLWVGYETRLLRKPALQDLHAMLEAVGREPLNGLQKALLADFNALLFSDLLPKMDIATMAFSLEGRSPFLSKELLEWVPGLDDRFKVRGRTTKYLLRALARKYLPTETVGQPKRGFEVPLKRWMDDELRGMTEDYLLGSPGALYPAFVQKRFVEDLLTRRVRVPAEKRAKMLYALLSLEVWHRHVYKSMGGGPFQGS